MHKGSHTDHWSSFSSLEITLVFMVVGLLTQVPGQLNGEEIGFFKKWFWGNWMSTCRVIGSLEVTEIGMLAFSSEKVTCFRGKGLPEYL